MKTMNRVRHFGLAPEPHEAPYRYSVKTDRAGNSKIEAMAKREGISPTALVQRHFETIFTIQKADGDYK